MLEVKRKRAEMHDDVAIHAALQHRGEDSNPYWVFILCIPHIDRYDIQNLMSTYHIPDSWYHWGGTEKEHGITPIALGRGSEWLWNELYRSQEPIETITVASFTNLLKQLGAHKRKKHDWKL